MSSDGKRFQIAGQPTDDSSFDQTDVVNVSQVFKVAD
jgi:hypothetical protein